MINRMPIDIPKKFFENVVIVDGDNCWFWVGYTKPRTKKSYDYALITLTPIMYAHRFSYSYFNKEFIPEGMFIMHTCDVPYCVNPKHLRLGTPKDNTQDAVSKGRMACGERHGLAKLSEKQALEIHNSNKSIKELMVEYNISDSQIERIKKGQRWAYLFNNQGGL